MAFLFLFPLCFLMEASWAVKTLTWEMDMKCINMCGRMFQMDIYHCI